MKLKVGQIYKVKWNNNTFKILKIERVCNAKHIMVKWKEGNIDYLGVNIIRTGCKLIKD